MTNSQRPFGPTDDEIRIALEKTKWGKTSLTKFFHNAEMYTRLTYLYLAGYFEMLESVDDIFKVVLDNLGYSEGSNRVINFLFERAHGNYLAAVRLSSSGQLPESYAQLRACIESALYAFNIYGDPKLAQVWLDRHKNEQSRKICRDSFTLITLQNNLIKADYPIGQAIKIDYNNCIDYGAHPNERSVSPNLKFDGRKLSVELLNTKDGIFQMCLFECVRCGFDAIRVFNLIYPDDFKKFNVKQGIQAIHAQLVQITPEISDMLST